MRVALSIMLMQENEPGGVPIRIKRFLHSSAVRYGEIFHSPSARVISLIYPGQEQSLDPTARMRSAG